MNNYVNKNKVLEKEFVAKWYNTVDEEKRRNDYINKEIDFWKLKSRSKRTYWELILPKAMPILDVLSGLKPVSDEMLSDFIAALTFSRFNLSQAGLLKEQMDEINRLALPVLSVLKEYLSSEGWRAYILFRCIPESKTIWNRYNAKQWDSVNEREALLFFSEDKEMLLLTGKQVEMLKSEYLKENEDTQSVKKTFIDYLKTDNPKNLADKLKSEFGDKKGRSIALMIIALEKLKYIEYEDAAKLFAAITEYFGDVGEYRGMMLYLTLYKTKNYVEGRRSYTDDEIKDALARIKKYGTA